MTIKKKLLVLILLLILSSFVYPRRIFSQCEGLTQEQCQQVVIEWAKKINSYSADLQYINSQIDLTNLRIQNTEQKIVTTQKEIDTIDSRIGGLDTSLDYLSKLLLNKIVESYKNRTLSIFTLLFNSASADDFFSRVKYLKTAQDNNQKLLVQVQETKFNFEQQKKLREDKKIELDNLKLTLDKQKIDLNTQQVTKNMLLAGAEAAYAQAQAQLAAFRSFVANTGLGIISANPSWPSGYFSQRDSRWASQLVNNSPLNCGTSDHFEPCNIFNVGCLVTSVAMVLKHHNVDTNPAAIASNANYFYGNTAQMDYRWQISWPNGLKGYSISSSQVDSELNSGNYVIVGINYGACRTNSSDHFVVLTKKDGNDYKMYDPLYGPDINFYSKYSQMCDVEVIK